MDATYLNPALVAIVNLMETMVKVHPERGDFSLKPNSIALGDVSSVIEMAGEGGRGSVSVSFSSQVIRAIAERMLPPGTPLEIDILKDLTGELANMIAGGMKTELEKHGLKFDISLPKLLAGKNHSIKHNTSSAVFLIPFTTELGVFHVEISFDKRKTDLNTVDLLEEIYEGMKPFFQNNLKTALRHTKSKIKESQVSQAEIALVSGFKLGKCDGSIALSVDRAVLGKCIQAQNPAANVQDKAMLLDCIVQIWSRLTSVLQLKLASSNEKIELTEPETVLGRGEVILHNTAADIFELRLETDFGPFFLEFGCEDLD